MIEDIRISVVIPSYSRCDSLRNAIHSVLQQTYQNYEIIVVDDNPADSEWRTKCALAMEEFAQNPRVRYLQNPQNLGGSGARNVGIENAKGEYVAFLDDDDVYLPERLEKQLAVFESTENEKLALVYCFAKFVDDQGNSSYSDRRVFRGNCIYEAMEQNCIAATSQWMAKKEALLAIGGFPIVPCKQDSQTILKLLAAGYEVDVVEEELSQYIDGGGVRISGFSDKNIRGELLYMVECRKQYYRLTTDQILNIEYRFASILYSKYKVMKKYSDMKVQWSIMRRIHWKQAYIHRIKELWHKIKGK